MLLQLSCRCESMAVATILKARRGPVVATLIGARIGWEAARGIELKAARDQTQTASLNAVIPAHLRHLCPTSVADSSRRLATSGFRLGAREAAMVGRAKLNLRLVGEGSHATASNALRRSPSLLTVRQIGVGRQIGAKSEEDVPLRGKRHANVSPIVPRTFQLVRSI